MGINRSLLSIDEQEDRYVRLFGSEYLLRRHDDLTHVQEVRYLQLLQTIAPQLDRLAAGEPASDEPRLNAEIRELCALACDAPPDVLARLKDLQCGQIVNLAFFAERLAAVSALTPTPASPSGTPSPRRAPRSTKRSRR